MATPESGHGSGFVVDGGLILTAQHVVDGARYVVVRLPGQEEFAAARVVVTSKQADVAVLANEKQSASVGRLVRDCQPLRATDFTSNSSSSQ